MPDAKISTTYVRPDRTAVLTCPHCNRQKEISVDSFKDHKNRLNVKCACKKTFTVILEYRKRVRKRTHLHGKYVNHSQKDRTGNLVVKNVSVSGLEFSSMDLPHFNLNDELTIEFTLDDEHMSVVRKEVTVVDIRIKSIGCEFSRSGEYAFDGPLGFYIMS